jgi:hypothetical protein
MVATRIPLHDETGIVSLFSCHNKPAHFTPVAISASETSKENTHKELPQRKTSLDDFIIVTYIEVVVKCPNLVRITWKLVWFERRSKR